MKYILFLLLSCPILIHAQELLQKKDSIRGNITYTTMKVLSGHHGLLANSGKNLSFSIAEQNGNYSLRIEASITAHYRFKINKGSAIYFKSVSGIDSLYNVSDDAITSTHRNRRNAMIKVTYFLSHDDVAFFKTVNLNSVEMDIAKHKPISYQVKEKNATALRNALSSF